MDVVVVASAHNDYYVPLEGQELTEWRKDNMDDDYPATVSDILPLFLFFVILRHPAEYH
jgi:hypothetical protein